MTWLKTWRMKSEIGFTLKSNGQIKCSLKDPSYIFSQRRNWKVSRLSVWWGRGVCFDISPRVTCRFWRRLWCWKRRAAGVCESIIIRSWNPVILNGGFNVLKVSSKKKEEGKKGSGAKDDKSEKKGKEDEEDLGYKLTSSEFVKQLKAADKTFVGEIKSLIGLNQSVTLSPNHSPIIY